MMRIKWPIALATLFIALLGWFVIYTQSIVSRVEENSQMLSGIFNNVQRALTAPGRSGEVLALLELQNIVAESGVPLVLMGPGDTVLAAMNLGGNDSTAAAEGALWTTPEGQAAIRAMVAEWDLRNPPVGDTLGQHIHYGDTPELRRFRWIPYLQAGGLLMTVMVGLTVIRFQRRAESERAWTAMARELAHQLGTPLSSLAGWLEVLRLPSDERPGDLRDAEIAGSIGEDLERLERISHRFELIGREPELQPLSLRQLVRDLERYLAARIPRLSRTGIDLVVEIPKNLPEVRGNEVLLIWALENVVKNALDALGGRGGKITIYAREVGGKWVSLRIRDDGPGVAPEIRDKIFEPGVTSKAGGWGVGLALSRRIVEGVHKGRIELLEGFEGTTFQIRLPVADA